MNYSPESRQPTQETEADYDFDLAVEKIDGLMSSSGDNAKAMGLIAEVYNHAPDEILKTPAREVYRNLKAMGNSTSRGEKQQYFEEAQANVAMLRNAVKEQQARNEDSRYKNAA